MPLKIVVDGKTKKTIPPKKKQPPKKNYDPKKGSPNAVKSMSAKTGSSKTKPVPMPKTKKKSTAVTKGFYMKPKTKVTKRGK